MGSVASPSVHSGSKRGKPLPPADASVVAAAAATAKAVAAHMDARQLMWRAAAASALLCRLLCMLLLALLLALARARLHWPEASEAVRLDDDEAAMTLVLDAGC